MLSTELVVARQPIFTREREVMGFELLYRSVDLGGARLSGDQMTAHVLLGAHSIGIDALVGDKLMFCNADRGVLVGDVEVTLPPSRTVIEILETVEPDDEVFEGCRRLAAAGYRLALDDFEWFSGAERFLELASIVKLDVLNCERSRIVELVTECRRFDVQLLAEKVETEQDIEFCLMLGFELFQGYALQQPQHVRGQEIVSSQLGRIELAATILSTELDLLGFERVLEHEPGLAVHLIQLASVGARYGIRRPVRSLRDALVLLGTTRLRRWVALLLLRDSGNIAPEAMATALVRARMCELLATRRRTGAPEQAFTAALLSCIDILTGATEVQTRSLELDPELRAAAFDPGTPLGELIGEVARYQQRCGVSDDDAEPDLDLAAAQAVTWALPYVNSLQAA